MTSEVLNPYYGVDYSFVCDTRNGRSLPIALSTFGFIAFETMAVSVVRNEEAKTLPFTLSCISASAILVIYGVVLFILVRRKPALPQNNP